MAIFIETNPFVANTISIKIQRMEPRTFIKKTLLVFTGICLMIGVTQAQARYKHIPRIKIKKNTVQSTIVNKEVSTTVIFNTPVNTESVIENKPSVIETEITTDSESTSEPLLQNSPVKHIRNANIQHHITSGKLNNMLHKHKRLSHPKGIQRTQASVAVILLIVFYILAAIFAVVSILFLYIPPGNFIMFLVFLILAIVFGLAGSILSILLKFGVVN
jgi:hypothetical protein